MKMITNGVTLGKFLDNLFEETVKQKLYNQGLKEKEKQNSTSSSDEMNEEESDLENSGDKQEITVDDDEEDDEHANLHYSQGFEHHYSIQHYITVLY